MHTGTTKKLLQDNCERLRSQIEELELRLRSSSVSKTAGGHAIPDRGSSKRHQRQERQETIKEKFNLFQEREQAKEDYDRALEKLSEEFQQNKDNLRKVYEARLADIDRLQQEQSRTIVNVMKFPPRPNKENQLNTSNVEKGRTKLTSQSKSKPTEANTRTPLGKSVTVNQRFVSQNSHLQYDSSSEEEEETRHPASRTVGKQHRHR